MKTIVTVVAGLTVADTVSVLSTADTSADARTSDDCRAIFRQLNANGDAKLAFREHDGSLLMTNGAADHLLREKGYLTEDDFTPTCLTPTRGTAAASQQQEPASV
jgi:hypothetical protein